MSGVNFSDRGQAEAWFAEQTMERRCLIASRGVLRVLAAIDRFEGKGKDRYALMSLRAALTTASRSVARPASVEGLERASDSAAELAFSVIRYALRYAHTAAHRAAHSAADSANFADRAASAYSAYRYALSSAHAAADSAADLARYDTHLAFQTDAEKPDDALVALPVWPSGQAPDWARKQHGIWVSYLNGDPDWAFWRRWYSQMWLGTFRDWDLAIEVALIPDEFWKGYDALSKVAREIERIEEELRDASDRADNVPELERKTLLEHVRKLLKDPEMTALAAEGAADVLDRAIRQYLDEAPANCLPEELRHLESVPAVFRRIATTVKSSERAEAKAERLAADIEALNDKIARLEADLKMARARSVEGLFTKSAIVAAGSAFGAGAIASLGMATSHFFGAWPGDLTLENLRGWLGDVQGAEPASEPPSLPPSFDA